MFGQTHRSPCVSQYRNGPERLGVLLVADAEHRELDRALTARRPSIATGEDRKVIGHPAGIRTMAGAAGRHVGIGRCGMRQPGFNPAPREYITAADGSPLDVNPRLDDRPAGPVKLVSAGSDRAWPCDLISLVAIAAAPGCRCRSHPQPEIPVEVLAVEPSCDPAGCRPADLASAASVSVRITALRPSSVMR